MMAANNYFGFTHGGTQYSSPAATYQTGQAGYAVAPAASYTAAARPAQTAYEGYQAAAASHSAAATYNFTTAAAAARAQDPPPPPPPPPATTPAYDAAYTFRASATTGAYDGTKTYYQQQPAAKTTFAAPGTFNNAVRGVAAAQKTVGSASNYGYGTAAVSTTYPTNYAAANSTAPPTTATNFSGYDAALYSAATMYVQQQQANTASVTNKPVSNWGTFKKPGMKMSKPKQPPKPQQLHYCDVCKISCAGPQTYREHLEGQKHKKKEAAAKTGTVVAQNVRPGNSLRCELCDVTCTGADAYAAHIRGAKHQKVVKLHTKLGKPIPSTEPTVVGAAPTAAVTNKTSVLAAAAVAAKQNAAKPLAPGTVVVASPTVIKTFVTPKITFVGGTKLSTTASTNPITEEATEEVKPDEPMTDDATLDMSKYDDKADILPVGQDYIEEIKNEEGKIVSFQCKLCECRFNDPNAKEMHMKGRRHRLQYKKKVNPDLIVDVKPSLRQRKIQEEKMRRQQMKEDVWRRREEDRWREEMRMMEEEERLYWEERRRYEEEMEYFEWYRRYGRDPRGIPPPMSRPFPGQSMSGMPPMPARRPDTLEDRHVVAKHADIYPKEEELQSVQKIVSNTEKALKQVSDFLAESQVQTAAVIEPKAALEDGVIKEEPVDEDETKEKETTEKEKENEEVEKKEEGPARILKGVMRVGVLAKGLLLKGDSDVQLVVLCSEKPTTTLLETVASSLPMQLAKITEDKYEIAVVSDAASIVVSTAIDPKINVHVTLTSPVVREAAPEEGGENVTIKDPPDVLDRQKCLDALAALRHAKWFQARASGLQSCVIIIRILRDLCQRVPTWSPLNSWAMELLVEKVLCSSGIPMSPGDSLRRVFEALASGVLLCGDTGLMDPCEKDPIDAAANLSDQEREDITASAQHALRLLAFRQIHKVLGMDPLPAPKYPKGRFTRKRRRDNSTGEGTESEGADGKKDKKDDGDVTMESVVSEEAETS